MRKDSRGRREKRRDGEGKRNWRKVGRMIRFKNGSRKRGRRKEGEIGK